MNKVFHFDNTRNKEDFMKQKEGDVCEYCKTVKHGIKKKHICNFNSEKNNQKKEK